MEATRIYNIYIYNMYIYTLSREGEREKAVMKWRRKKERGKTEGGTTGPR